MIVLLAAILGGSMIGLLVAWVQAASILMMVFGYIAGGWIGMLLAALAMVTHSGSDGNSLVRCWQGIASRRSPQPTNAAALSQADNRR